MTIKQKFPYQLDAGNKIKTKDGFYAEVKGVAYDRERMMYRIDYQNATSTYCSQIKKIEVICGN